MLVHQSFVKVAVPAAVYVSQLQQLWHAAVADAVADAQLQRFGEQPLAQAWDLLHWLDSLLQAPHQWAVPLQKVLTEHAGAVSRHEHGFGATAAAGNRAAVGGVAPVVDAAVCVAHPVSVPCCPDYVLVQHSEEPCCAGAEGGQHLQWPVQACCQWERLLWGVWWI
jgi:hypothetical protein